MCKVVGLFGKPPLSRGMIFFFNRKKKSLVWWHMPIISSLGRQKEEKFKARPCFKANKQKSKGESSPPHLTSTWREEEWETGRDPELSEVQKRDRAWSRAQGYGACIDHIDKRTPHDYKGRDQSDLFTIHRTPRVT